MITIREIEQSAWEIYTQFTSDNKHIVFADPKWLSLVAKKEDWKFFGLYENERLNGVFPILLRNGRVFKSFSYPVLTPYIGIVLRNEIIEPAQKRPYTEAFVNYIRSLVFDAFYCAFPPSFKDIVPFKSAGISFIPKQSYLLDISQTEEEIQKHFRSDKQRNIKKCIKENVRVSFDKDADTLLKLTLQTYQRQKAHNTWSDIIPELVANFSNSFQVTVYDGDQAGCSLFVVYDDQRAYYLFGGVNDSLNNSNLGPFAMWQAILKTKELGLRIFDFEGSEIPTIETYFQSFGSTPELYFSIEMFSFKFKLFQWFK